jgi:hypothetical protein
MTMKPAARKVLLTMLFAAAAFGFGTSREGHAQFGGAFGGDGPLSSMFGPMKPPGLPMSSTTFFCRCTGL